MNYLKLILLTLLLGTHGTPTYAQMGDSLESHLEYAARNNPGVMQKYLEYKAAREKSPQASSLPDPQLEVGVLPMPMKLPGGDLVAEVKIMQMFPWFGTLKAAEDEATFMAIAKYESYRGVQNDLALQIKSIWYQAYKIKEEISITQKNLQLLQSLERLALVKIQTGDAAPPPMNSNSAQTPNGKMSFSSPGPSGMNMNQGASSSSRPGMATDGNMQGEGKMEGSSGNASEMANVFRLRIEMLGLENNITALKDRFETLQFEFNSLLNRKQTPLILPDSLNPGNPEFKEHPGSSAVYQHPMVQMSLADQSASEAKLRMVSRMGYPMLGIGLNYSILRSNPATAPPGGMNGDDMIMPMVSISLPIFRKKYRAMKKETLYEKEATEKFKQNVLLNLKVQYDESLKRYQEAERDHQMYTKQASLAQQGVKIMTTTFATGAGEFDALLRLQQDLLNYQIKQNESLANKYIAAAELNALINNNFTYSGENRNEP